MGRARMTATPPIASRGVIVVYYAATALFLMLDYGLGLNVRLAFLDAYPVWRAAYYGSCFLCLAAILWRPAAAVIVATLESLVTMVALILHMWLRVMGMTHGTLETSSGLVTMPEIINFLISGSFAYFTWSRGMKALQGR